MQPLVLCHQGFRVVTEHTPVTSLTVQLAQEVPISPVAQKIINSASSHSQII